MFDIARTLFWIMYRQLWLNYWLRHELIGYVSEGLIYFAHADYTHCGILVVHVSGLCLRVRHVFHLWGYVWFSVHAPIYTLDRFGASLDCSDELPLIYQILKCADWCSFFKRQRRQFNFLGSQRLEDVTSSSFKSFALPYHNLMNELFYFENGCWSQVYWNVLFSPLLSLFFNKPWKSIDNIVLLNNTTPSTH